MVERRILFLHHFILLATQKRFKLKSTGLNIGKPLGFAATRDKDKLIFLFLMNVSNCINFISLNLTAIYRVNK